MSAATPLGFHARARNYMAQSGREWDPHRMSLDQATPAQRRRLMHKERRAWRSYAFQLILAYTMRQAAALTELCLMQRLEPGPYLSDILPAIDDAARAANAAGLTVPSLPEE